MLKNLANEINNLLLDNEEKTQEILNLNSSIGSLNTTIEVLQNENQSLFGFAFLIYTHDGVQNNDQNDQAGLKQLTPVFLNADDYKRNDGGSDEDQDHYVLELIHKTLQGSFLFLFAELVGAILSLAGAYFLGGKTAFLVGGKRVQHVFHIIVVECQCCILL